MGPETQHAPAATASGDRRRQRRNSSGDARVRFKILLKMPGAGGALFSRLSLYVRTCVRARVHVRGTGAYWVALLWPAGRRLYWRRTAGRCNGTFDLSVRCCFFSSPLCVRAFADARARDRAAHALRVCAGQPGAAMAGGESRDGARFDVVAAFFFWPLCGRAFAHTRARARATHALRVCVG